jgi:hypothetical protein
LAIKIPIYIKLHADLTNTLQKQKTPNIGGRFENTTQGAAIMN